MILTHRFPIRNTPELSRWIDYLASQQRRAYNQAVEWLNREPGLQRLKTGRAAQHRTLNARLTQLRGADPRWRECPRRIHDAGVRLAVLAQHKSRINNERRWAEIAVGAWFKNPYAGASNQALSCGFRLRSSGTNPYLVFIVHSDGTWRIRKRTGNQPSGVVLGDRSPACALAIAGGTTSQPWQREDYAAFFLNGQWMQVSSGRDIFPLGSGTDSCSKWKSMALGR